MEYINIEIIIKGYLNKDKSEEEKSVRIIRYPLDDSINLNKFNEIYILNIKKLRKNILDILEIKENKVSIGIFLDNKPIAMNISYTTALSSFFEREKSKLLDSVNFIFDDSEYTKWTRKQKIKKILSK